MFVYVSAGHSSKQKKTLVSEPDAKRSSKVWVLMFFMVGGDLRLHKDAGRQSQRQQNVKRLIHYPFENIHWENIACGQYHTRQKRVRRSSPDFTGDYRNSKQSMQHSELNLNGREEIFML